MSGRAHKTSDLEMILKLKNPSILMKECVEASKILLRQKKLEF